MTADQYGDTRITWQGHVAVVEIDKPPHNHVSVKLITDLADAFEALDGDANCRVILLTSAGRTFCGGADLQAPGGLSGSGAMEGINPLYTAAVRLFACNKPIVAAVQGSAVGAGLGLALVADFRIASPEARFSANFVKLGFHPGFGISHTLKRVVGEQKAALMMLTGRRVKPDEALAWGLVDAVVSAHDLRDEALAFAAEIAETAPLAVQSTRATTRDGLAEAVRAQTDIEFREQSWLRATADFAEGVRAVAERRPGAFVGK
jgi:enoyl-CoA hydratase/carnithine racemase